MRKIVLLFTILATFTNTKAQVNLNFANATYSQDFNTLSDTGNANSMTLTGWAIKEIGTSASANNKYRTGYGSSNAGDVYSFGDSASTERALGSISSGTNATSFGVMFMNASTDTIQKFVISHKLEQWRAGDTATRQDTTYFYYSTTADSVGDTAAANWTEVPSLMLNSIITVSTSTSGNSLDGNAAANSTSMADSVNVTVLPGQHLIFKWVDKNITGSDDGLAIDDLNVIFRGTGAVGIADTKYSVLPLSVLGNSTANSMTIGFTAAKAGMYSLKVFDAAGRLMHSEKINANPGAQQYTINNMALAAGLYIVKVNNGTETGTTKAVVR